MPEFLVTVTEHIKLSFNVTAESKDAAEAEFKRLVEEEGLIEAVEMDSAGYSLESIEEV